jgi:hypothetical protein
MTRRTYIERVRRLIYNGLPADDATVTVGLVNNYLNDAIAIAAKTNYTDTLKLDGIACVNNSFYTTFKSLSVVEDEQFLWRVTLPEIPVGIGSNEGVSTLIFRDYESRQLSSPVVWLTENQLSFQRGMRTIPNKILAYPQGQYIYVMSTLTLSDYTANITMVSGGLSTDLDSILNVPGDYFPVMQDYIIKNLLMEQAQPVDATNDGLDAARGTQ